VRVGGVVVRRCFETLGVGCGPGEPFDQLRRVVLVVEVGGDDAFAECHTAAVAVGLVGLDDDLGREPPAFRTHTSALMPYRSGALWLGAARDRDLRWASQHANDVHRSGRELAAKLEVGISEIHSEHVAQISELLG
jgi:hypothetical protein